MSQVINQLIRVDSRGWYNVNDVITFYIKKPNVKKAKEWIDCNYPSLRQSDGNSIFKCKYGKKQLGREDLCINPDRVEGLLRAIRQWINYIQQQENKHDRDRELQTVKNIETVNSKYYELLDAKIALKEQELINLDSVETTKVDKQIEKEFLKFEEKLKST